MDAESGEVLFARHADSRRYPASITKVMTLYLTFEALASGRLKLDDLLMQFDYPDANVHAEKRSATTTAIQKLFVLNSPFMSERAKKLAQRVAAEAGGSETTQVRLVHRLLFNREPDAEELRLATDFLARPAAGELPRWEQYAQLMLASNELLYVD